MARVIRRTVTETNRRIGVNNFDVEADRVGLALADAGETLRRKAFEIDAKKAEVTAEEAVMAIDSSQFMKFDENGMPVAMKPPEGYGSIAREAFRRVAEKRFADTIDQDIRLEAQKYRVQHSRNPIAFKNAMDSYLKALGTNADGRFQELIANVGTAIQEGHYYDLLDKQRERARTNQAEGIVAGNADAAPQLYELALNQNAGKALTIAQDRKQATADGEEAELLKTGAADAYYSGVTGDIAAAALIGVISKGTFDEDERQQIATMISTSGKYEAADEDIKALFSKRIKYKTPDGKEATTSLAELITVENKKSVSAAVTSVIADMDGVDAIRRANKATQEAQNAKTLIKQTKENKIDLNEIATLDANSAIRKAKESFIEGGDIVGAIQSLGAIHQEYVTALDRQMDANPDFMSITEYNAAIVRHRTSLLEPFIMRASLDGDAENFRAFMGNGIVDPSLKRSQRQVVKAAHKFGLFKTGDMSVLSATFSAGESATLTAMEKADSIIDITERYYDLNGAILGGDDILDKDIDALKKEIDSSPLGPEKKIIYKRNLDVSKAKRNLEIYSKSLNAERLQLLSQYIGNRVDLSESVLTGLTNDEKEFADFALQGFSDAERNAVASEVQQIASIRAGQEEKQRKALEKAMLRERFFSGKMEETSQTAKDIADEELKAIGFNIQDPSTWTEKSFFIMKRSIGSDLINQYNNLAKGDTVKNLNELMQLYSRLKNFETTNPTTKEIVKRNLLKGQVDAITEVTIDAALLGNSLGLYTSFDDAVANLNLSGTKASPAEVKNYKEALFVNSEGTSIKPDEFVDIVLETEGDFVVNNELGMLANQMAGKMFPQELIVPMIKQAFGDRYKEAKYIYDPARPIGEKGKSRHSLSVIFDDPNMTEYVTDQINNQLVEVGYTLTNIHDENWQSDVAIGDLNETDPMIGYFQEGAEMASEAKGEARFFRGKRTQGENLKAAVLVPMFPNIARPADQVFQVMEVVEVIPEGTERGYYELKPLIVDDKPMGFKISDEAKDYVDPDLTNQQINKKSIDELRQERENFNVINEVMTGLKEGKFR
mgnify:CR=1 FL=1